MFGIKRKRFFFNRFFYNLETTAYVLFFFRVDLKIFTSTFPLEKNCLKMNINIYQLHSTSPLFFFFLVAQHGQERVRIKPTTGTRSRLNKVIVYRFVPQG